MGKLKPEMKIIHQKKHKKARSQIKLFEEKKITLNKLTTFAKKLFYKKTKNKA